MKDLLPGFLIMLGWLGVLWLLMKAFPPPQSSTTSWLIVIGSIVLTILGANLLNKIFSSQQKTYSIVYPENWEEIRKQVLVRDGHCCGNCGSFNDLHVHHIVPLSKGGTNQLSNLRTLCKECHTKIHPHMQN